MAYTTLPTHRTVQVISATQVLDVMELPFITSPSGVTAQVYAPYVSWLAEGADPFIAPIATAIENLISGGLAVGGTFTQDVDPTSGLLVDYVTFTVAYTPTDGRGTFTTTVDVPMTALGADTGFGAIVSSLSPADIVNTAYQQLVATAGL